MRVYHYTDTARLPFILKSGELQVGKNRALDRRLPPDFLWATSNPNGDRTATTSIGLNKEALKAGHTRSIRFILHSNDFVKWETFRAQLLASGEWNILHMSILENSAAKLGGNPREWYARREPLPLERVIAIQHKSWSEHWKLLETREFEASPDNPNWLGMFIGNKFYHSEQLENEGPIAYRTGQPVPITAFERDQGKKR